MGIRGLLAKQRARQTPLPSADRSQTSVASGDLAAAAGGGRRPAASTRTRPRRSPATRSGGRPRSFRCVGPEPRGGAHRRGRDRHGRRAGRSRRSSRVGARGRPARAQAGRQGPIDLAPLAAAQPVVARAQTAFARRARSRSTRIDTGAHARPGRRRRRATSRDVARPGRRRPSTPLGNSVAPAARDARRGRPARPTCCSRRTRPSCARPAGWSARWRSIHADHGAISLRRAGRRHGLPARGRPRSPTSRPRTQGLYGPLVGRYIQDVEPDARLPARGATASRDVDDEVRRNRRRRRSRSIRSSLSYVCSRRPGPVTLPTGDRLTSSQRRAAAAERRLPAVSGPGASRTRSSPPRPAPCSAGSRPGGRTATKLVTALAAAGEARRMLDLERPRRGADDPRVDDARRRAARVRRVDGRHRRLLQRRHRREDGLLPRVTSVAAGAAVCRADGKPSTRVVTSR